MNGYYIKESEGEHYLVSSTGAYQKISAAAAEMIDKVLKAWREEGEHVIRLKKEKDEIKRAARDVMDLLEEKGADIVPHLLDDDENAGQRLRELL